MSSRRVIYAPLDWGLGHATRCIPLIDKDLSAGGEVILAADGGAYDLLKSHYPELEIVRFPGFKVRYGSGSSFLLNLTTQFPSFLRSLKEENELLDRLVRQYKPDLIISDNRYGVYHPNVTSELITHQLSPQGPVLLKPIIDSWLNRQFRHFQKILVPDFAEEQKCLAGALSRRDTLPVAVEYLGPLSRFASQSKAEPRPEAEYKVVAMVSGPEPSRTEFEEKLTNILSQLDSPSLLVQGRPGDALEAKVGNCKVLNHLGDEALSHAVRSATSVISRSGYSTVMDLHYLGKKGILIPTPGQTEQEYLAQYLDQKGVHNHLSEAELNLQSLSALVERPS